MQQCFSPLHFFSSESCAHPLFQGVDGVWEALNRLHDYLLTQPLGKIEVEIPEGVYLVDPHLISIGRGSEIEPGAYIKGPCIIGKNCSIRHTAYLRGDVLVEEGSVIGHASEVKHSIFLKNAKAAHFAYVGDSILGEGVNLGAGTRLANLRFDHAEICIKSGGGTIPTGRKKLGAILGDGVQTGCNSVCNPGTICYPETFLLPCKAVSGVIARKMSSTFKT
jgi:UDP-N-acetylglucosamine diphosphorylase / glucose-1-phosphate thymidylyltransferase / UDP-N-acetylgalactosamine diphosphorylase / glucosamine-1-phosphate N-acetyltransferase / galactosamine-1-phosphate N-acetyltransferase